MNDKISALLYLFLILKRAIIISSRRRASGRIRSKVSNNILNNIPIVNHRRQIQELAKQYSENAICLTMEPPSKLAPTNSNCFEYNDPNGASKKRKGCDYKPCENAVCSCDSYCCEVSWDISCRGYMQETPFNKKEESTKSNNNNNDIYYHIINGCSAKLLCCEQQNNDENDIMNILPILKDAPKRSINYDYLLHDDDVVVVHDEICINNNSSIDNHGNSTTTTTTMKSSLLEFFEINKDMETNKKSK